MAAPELAGHLSAEGLGRRYRAARDRVERGHLQVVWLLAQGRSGRAVARVVGLSERWVAEIVRRYDGGGPDGLGDRRRGDAGAKPLLDEAQREALVRALRGAPPEGGLWSGPEVAAWIARTTGREVHPQRGWDYLKKLGFTLKRPRPRHARADAAAQAAFKKGAADAAGRASGRAPRGGVRAVGHG
jgi:transposase